MKRLLLAGQRAWFICCGLIVTMAMAGSLPAAELLPFPAPAQPAPSAQQAPPQGRAAGEFRSEIARLTCPELQDLINRIQEQVSRSATGEDRQYYHRILQDLQRESEARCQP